MINELRYGSVRTAGQWEDLRRNLDPGGKSRFLSGLIAQFREAGGVYYILERVYVDRDYAKAYASFYYKTHFTKSRYCTRLHVFAKSLSHLEKLPADEFALNLEVAGRESYRGFAVLRPVSHAPVSWAVVASNDILDPNSEILVRGTHTVHFRDAELSVVGAAATEQDLRTGSCAQAAIWGAARNLHVRRGMPWHSVVDITDAATATTDADLATSLPVGASRLSQDAMVRAMKGMGLHPLVYRC